MASAPGGMDLRETYRANTARLADEIWRLSDTIRQHGNDPFTQRRLDTLESMAAKRPAVVLDANGDPALVERGRQFLSFDAAIKERGLGRAIEVVGDLDSASHIVVSLPGMGNSLDTLDAQASRARQLLAEAGPGTAVVCWHDYEFPQSLNAVSRGYAEIAARRLTSFVAQLHERFPQADTTLVGNSYGSLVLAEAIRGDLNCDRAVLVGCPGIHPTVRSAADLRPGERPEIFTARTLRDPVVLARWFGPDPAGFTDAVRVKVEGSGHEAYWTPGNEFMRNLGRIARGDTAAVTTSPPANSRQEIIAAGVLRVVDRGLRIPVERIIKGPIQDSYAGSGGWPVLPALPALPAGSGLAGGPALPGGPALAGGAALPGGAAVAGGAPTPSGPSLPVRRRFGLAARVGDGPGR